CVAMVRPQRGRGVALPLPRLEIRRDWSVPRSAVGAGCKRLLSKDQAEVLPTRRARAGAVDVYGTVGQATAPAGMGICNRTGRQDFHFKALAGVQLAASDGGRN